MIAETTSLPRKWTRVAPGRLELEHDGCTFDARDRSVVEPGAGWRLECVGPSGADTFSHLRDFATVKKRAADWYERSRT